MKNPLKLAGFAVGLAAVFGIALGLGALAGPVDEEASAHGNGAHESTPSEGGEVGGLTDTAGGYTLTLLEPTVSPGSRVPLRFRISDADGSPVTRYTPNHEKDLHLIVVRRDMAVFRHLHPVLDEQGTWSVPVDLSRAGDYRVFADFVTADGQPFTLGADLRVTGDYHPQPLPKAATTTTVDGYTVTLDGTLVPGRASTVTLTVSRDGEPVTDLEPYLGAYGHLVALRATDLGYLHVHPEGHPGDGVTKAGPDITFAVTAPSAGDYRMFLDFRHRGVVRTAEFTVVAAPATPMTGDHPEPPVAGPGHTHHPSHSGHGH
ncbi:hypothetical protein [Nocardia paucivorans]|uniref:hypothetical protein n=1 Tax=Nocardia paucivorans TaxID=114259 RepID=UPI000308B7A1|nr:hypothetical protein [Nocardia paucivorans]